VNSKLQKLLEKKKEMIRKEKSYKPIPTCDTCGKEVKFTGKKWLHLKPDSSHKPDVYHS